MLTISVKLNTRMLKCTLQNLLRLNRSIQQSKGYCSLKNTTSTPRVNRASCTACSSENGPLSYR